MLLRCSDASDRVAAALLGRFLPRLGPPAPPTALFSLALAEKLADSRGGPCDKGHAGRGTCRASCSDCCYAAGATRPPPDRAATPRAGWPRGGRPASQGARPIG